VSNDKNPLDRALELLVFAPVGLALTARKALPELIEQGRQQVTGQVTMAKMMGQYAVQQAETEAGKVVGQATEALEGLGLTGRSAGGAAGSPVTPTGAATPTTAASPAPEAASNGPTPSPVRPSGPSSSAAAADLAIPDYDSLSASQVVPRLSGLSDDELDAVRAYEEAHRARKTILNKVAQVRAS
jgi:hypothetical protein